MSKNEIFSWEFRKFANQLLKKLKKKPKTKNKKKKASNHCFFQYRNMNYIYFNIQTPSIFTWEVSVGEN